MTEKKKIFISYKRNVEPDEPVALELFSSLSKEHDVFIDLKMMVGTKWSREIQENLLSSDFFISLISENSVKSDMVSTEIQMAYKQSRIKGSPIILPVRLNYFEDLEYDLTAYLDSRNYLSWKNYSDTKDVISQLQQVINGERYSNEKVLDLIQKRLKEKEKLIRSFLAAGEFDKARIEGEKLLEQNNELHLIHLLIAVAILGKKGISFSSLSSIKRLEKHVEKASEDMKLQATALVLWGVIKHNHYFLKGLSQGTPSLETIKGLLEDTDSNFIDFELLEVVNIDKITSKALGIDKDFIK
ncbi:MAG: toll/interleukin-1 receptor domain-containing protein [bacterium]|nr:toll/interleukin-1 receptor domain-containing protein [bacterium]